MQHEYARWPVHSHASQYFLVSAVMVLSIVSLWWASLSQETAAMFLGFVIISWVVGVVSRSLNSDKAMLGGSVLLGYVSVRIRVGSMEVSR